MTHSSTELLIDYWQSRIFAGKAPTRASIDPTDFPTLLPQVFILGRRGPGDYIFRLAGGLVGDLHRMDLRGAAFTHLWEQAARLPIQTALEGARRRITPIRLTAEGHSGAYRLPLNIVLLPLSKADGEVDRFLGLYQPAAPVSELAGQPIHRLQLNAIGATTLLRDGAAAEAPHIRLAAIGGSRVG